MFLWREDRNITAATECPSGPTQVAAFLRVYMFAWFSSYPAKRNGRGSQTEDLFG
jgi:hypothetical protein